jgi:Ca2+-binding EF-hand superfamily protein
MDCFGGVVARRGRPKPVLEGVYDMKPLVIGAAVGGVVLVAGAVALLPKEEAPPVVTPAPTPRPEPVVQQPPEPVIQQVEGAEWQRRMQNGPWGDQMRQYTAEFDRDGDGVLNPDEMRAAWEAFEQRNLAQWDKDGDGTLSDEERRAGMEAMIRERTEAEMTRRFDRDGDGELNADEQAALDAARAERQARRQQWELQQYDLNKDGVIADSEREQVDTQRRERQQRIEAAMTQRFDADGDGQLSRLERRAAGETMRQEFRDIRTARRVDADGNGIADASDLSAWAQKIAAGDMAADFTNDGVLDQRDLQWANEAIATAATRRVDPAWEALMTEMFQGGGQRMGPVRGGGDWGGGDRVMRIEGVQRENRDAPPQNAPQQAPPPGR